MSNADWRRPRGVAPGTWAYTNERTIADHYDQFVADTPLCGRDREILARELPGPPPQANETVLDLGCGSGRSAIPLAECGYRVVGIDLSQPMLAELMRKQCSPTGPKPTIPVACLRTNLVEMDAISAASADHAICLFSTLGMIQGRQHRRQFLGHVHRILRPGGKLIVHVHNKFAALREPGGISKLIASRLRSWTDAAHEFGDATYAYRGLENMFMHRFSRRELLSDLAATQWQLQSFNQLTIDGTGFVDRPGLLANRAGGFIIVATR